MQSVLLCSILCMGQPVPGELISALRKGAESHFRDAPRQPVKRSEPRSTLRDGESPNDFLKVLSRLTEYRSERESWTNQQLPVSDRGPQ